jgi:trk system potassium uptake protein TrkA
MAPDKLFVLIVGCGRLGSQLAGELSRQGHSVVAVDANPDAFAALPAEYSGFRVEGDATELAVLRQAEIGNADLVIAATREDNVNLMVAQVARRIFKVPRVIARVFDPRREQVYRDLGVDTVCPTTIAANALLAKLAEERPSAEGGEGQ